MHTEGSLRLCRDRAGCTLLRGCAQASEQLAVVRESHDRTGREVRTPARSFACSCTPNVMVGACANADLLHTCCSHPTPPPAAAPSEPCWCCVPSNIPLHTPHVQVEAAHAKVQALQQRVAELERQVDQERLGRAEQDSELEVAAGGTVQGPL
jgi:hypothetical protein